jgi:hypothetical protein
MIRPSSSAFALLAVAALAGCGGKVVVDHLASDVDPGTGGAGTTSASTSATSGAGGQGGSPIFDGGVMDAGDPVDAGDDGGPPQPPEVAVYAHSGDTLYVLNPFSKAISEVGKFDGCNKVVDLAVDRQGKLYGTSPGALFTIDPKTAKCNVISSGGYPNSLSFVPQGTVDANEEALVGYLESNYVRIDVKSGDIKTIGQLGGGYASSGDIVSVIGGGTYLTVTSNDCFDCIVEVDPKSGSMVKMLGKLPYFKVWGLAYWSGKAYGFTSTGQLFQIDLPSTKTTEIPIPNAPPGLSFWGAGSSTAAPL